MHAPSDGQRSITDSDFDLSSGLGSETENPALRDAILAEIGANGPLTFARFMELALYHTTEGYYAGSRERIGRSGDYVTSPEISPIFGYAIALQLAEMWEILERPARFTISEFGAGAGKLAQDILRWTARRTPAFHSHIVYRLIERSRSLRSILRESMNGTAGSANIEIVDAAPGRAAGGSAGCVLANELVDSFPAHRVVIRDGGLRELYVTARGNVLTQIEGDVSTFSLVEYFKRLGMLPGEGCVAEVNLCAAPWLQEASESIGRGYILLFDYGYEAARLYAPWRRTGTLLCYHRQDVSEDPLVRVGRQDITAHVDFTSLAAAARDAQLQDLARTDQTHFLSRLGVGGSVRIPAVGDSAIAEFYARRNAVTALLDPAGLGRIGVLLFGRGVSVGSLTGFASDT
jgi:SAM-dependent MidA family methyltransferase